MSNPVIPKQTTAFLAGVSFLAAVVLAVLFGSAGAAADTAATESGRSDPERYAICVKAEDPIRTDPWTTEAVILPQAAAVHRQVSDLHAKHV